MSKRDPWKTLEVIDRMHTLLIGDNERAGDKARAAWHRRTRDQLRRDLDAAASIFCRRPVTGYTRGF